MPLKLNGEVVKFEDAESFIQFMTNCDVSGSQFRKGQLAFNVLREHKPLLAEKIRGVLGLDPLQRPKFRKILQGSKRTMEQ